MNYCIENEGPIKIAAAAVFEYNRKKLTTLVSIMSLLQYVCFIWKRTVQICRFLKHPLNATPVRYVNFKSKEKIQFSIFSPLETRVTAYSRLQHQFNEFVLRMTCTSMSNFIVGLLYILFNIMISFSLVFIFLLLLFFLFFYFFKFQLSKKVLSWS